MAKARRKADYCVLVTTADGFKLATVNVVLADYAACSRWITQFGESDKRYQRAAFLGEPLAVKVDMVEKRKLVSTDPEPKLLDKGESEPVE